MGEVIEVRTGDGLKLVVEHHPARTVSGQRDLGAVWLGHAMLANRRSLDRPAGGGLASQIASAGLHAYTVDFRGHGAARGSNGTIQWKYEDLIRHDFPAVTSLLRERHPELPLAAVGHSLTAHAAVAWLGTESSNGRTSPIAALVTIGANVWIRDLERSRLRWIRKRAALALFGGVGFCMRKIPARSIGLGSDDAPYTFVQQWLAWARHNRWGAPGDIDYLATAASIDLPVLAVLGTGDQLICHPDSGRQFHNHLSRAVVDLHLAGPENLGFHPDHMGLVTDPRSRPLWIRIASWLADKLGSAGAITGTR